MININFLANRKNQKSRQKERDVRLFRWSIYTTAVMSVLAIGMLLFKLSVNLQINANENKIKEYRDSILAQERVELSYLIFVNKIKVISEIYQKRSNKQEAMDYFAQAMGETAEITGMNYQEDQGGLVLQLSSSNIFQLEATNAILDAPELRAQYAHLEKSALTRVDNGSYKLNLRLELKKDD